MIHLVYCYFLVNAFCSGCMIEDKEYGNWKAMAFLFFFAVPVLICMGLWFLYNKLDALLEIRTLFFLTFTDKLRKWKDDQEMRESLIEWYPYMTRYKQRIMQKWAKKYGVKL